MFLKLAVVIMKHLGTTAVRAKSVSRFLTFTEKPGAVHKQRAASQNTLLIATPANMSCCHQLHCYDVWSFHYKTRGECVNKSGSLEELNPHE